MRKVFGRLVVRAAALSLAIAPVALADPATAPSSDSPAPVQIDQLLTISSHKQLMEMAIGQLETLANELHDVTDADSARQAREPAERTYLGLELVSMRMPMLDAPTKPELAEIQQLHPRYVCAQAKLLKECERIMHDEKMAAPLRSVTRPINQEFVMLVRSRTNASVSILQTLRSQIELYKLRHRDQLPDFKKSGWKQLTEKTNADGSVSSTGKYGPYLQTSPMNPLINSSRLLIVHATPKPDFHYGKKDCGFVYDDSTGKIWALSADGTLFEEKPGAQVRVE